MAKIQIKDLPFNMKIEKEALKQITGGFNPQPEPPALWSDLQKPYYGTRTGQILGTKLAHTFVGLFNMQR